MNVKGLVSELKAVGIGEFGAIESRKAALSLSSLGPVRSASDSRVPSSGSSFCDASVLHFKADSKILMREMT